MKKKQKKIVIDTNIWVRSMVSEELQISCMEAMTKFLGQDNLMIALDYEGEMEREYRDNISNNRRFELEWKELERKQRKCWVSSKLNHNYVEHLKDIKFHEPEDHIFVGAAMNADKMIVTNDSDYGASDEPEKKEIFEYMRDEMDLTVYSSKRFVDWVNSEYIPYGERIE